MRRIQSACAALRASASALRLRARGRLARLASACARSRRIWRPRARSPRLASARLVGLRFASAARFSSAAFFSRSRFSLSRALALALASSSCFALSAMLGLVRARLSTAGAAAARPWARCGRRRLRRLGASATRDRGAAPVHRAAHRARRSRLPAARFCQRTDQTSTPMNAAWTRIASASASLPPGRARRVAVVRRGVRPSSAFRSAAAARAGPPCARRCAAAGRARRARPRSARPCRRRSPRPGRARAACLATMRATSSSRETLTRRRARRRLVAQPQRLVVAQRHLERRDRHGELAADRRQLDLARRSPAAP